MAENIEGLGYPTAVSRHIMGVTLHGTRQERAAAAAAAATQQGSVEGGVTVAPHISADMAAHAQPVAHVLAEQVPAPESYVV